MKAASRKLEGLVWSALALVMMGLVAAYVAGRLRGPPARPEPALPVYGQVSGFTLTNQHGRKVTLADLRGCIWVADIIFTRCAGPCPIITRRLSELQNGLPADAPVRLVSLTTDPLYDTPAVLERYAARFQADPGRWHFLTGPKAEICRLATKDLLLVVVENTPEERTAPDELFLHSIRFILVDQAGRLRGIYDGESDATRPRLLEAIARLAREHPSQP